MTHTYAILEVSATAYDDVKKRLIEAAGEREWGYHYRGQHDDKEIIVLGTVALKAEGK